MAQFILVYTHPTEGEKRIDLDSIRSYRIGSHPDNDIVFDQKDVSRRHAVLRVDDGSFHITDLDSKNGTFINGVKTASETFICGDMIHLSSARLVIVEVGTGSYPTAPDVILNRDDESGARGREETQNYRSEATMEDVISLLETTAAAVRRGALADPLIWAVNHLGFDGAVILYRDENDSVAMVSSAGELGELARRSEVLAKLATEHKLSNPAGTRVRQAKEMGEDLLVASVGTDHVLVVRYAGRPPAIGDLRSLIASVDAVLGSGQGVRQSVATAATGSAMPEDNADGGEFSDGADTSTAAESVPDLDLEALVDMDLAEARNRFEAWIIRRALAATDGKQTQAAERLGLSRAGFFKKMRKLGL